MFSHLFSHCVTKQMYRLKMTTFKDRVLSLWPDKTVAKISEMIGISHMGLSRVFREGTLPKADTLLNIHNQSGCDLKWLMTGEGSPYLNTPDENEKSEQEVEIKQKNNNPSTPKIQDVCGNPVNIEDFVFIPRYDVQASAGNGYLNGCEKIKCTMAFRKAWIENSLNANPHDLVVISVKGDSMEGILNERDVILVNKAQNQPGNGLYVVRIGNDLIVKRIQSLPGGKLLVTSANEAYAPFELDLAQDYNDISIIGKVLWFGRSI